MTVSDKVSKAASPVATPPEGTRGAVVRHPRQKVADYAPTRLGLPVKEEGVIQLAAGDLSPELELASSADATLMRIGVKIASIGITCMDPAYMAFAIPVSWTGDYLINGEPADAAAIYSSGGTDTFYIRGSYRETLGAVVRARAFAETIAALRGVGVEDVVLNDFKLGLPAAAGAQLRQRLGVVLAANTRADTEYSPQQFTNAVVGLMADAYLFASPVADLRNNHARNNHRIVRKAEERFAAANGRPVSLADLCVAAGVSKSTLYHAFHHVCGSPPLEYFHKRRLARARSILVNTAPARGGVKIAALDCGFTELGRFSVEYRMIFGELPSVTLNKDPV